MRTILEKLKYQQTERPYYFQVISSGEGAYPWNSVLVTYGGIDGFARQGLPYDREKTLIMTESGGIAKAHAGNQQQCLEFQARIKPDIAFLLDYSLRIKTAKSLDKHQVFYDGTSELERIKKIQKNLENARIAMKLKEKIGYDFELMAIIHAFDMKTTTFVTNEMYSMGFNVFGAHGVYIQKTADKILERQSFVEIRDVIGKHCWLHALGITEVPLLRKIWNMIDSFDSASAAIATAKGYIFYEGNWRNIALRPRTSEKRTEIAFVSNNPDFVNLRKNNSNIFDDVNEIDRQKDITDAEALGKVGRNQNLREVNFRNFTDYLKRELWKQLA